VSERPRMPIQPKVTDERGVERFAENRIITKLLDDGPFDLNDIVTWGFSENEYFQLRQQIGYSISGIPYPDEASAAEVDNAHGARKESETARADAAEAKLTEVREGLKPGLSALYEKHPDDFTDRF